MTEIQNRKVPLGITTRPRTEYVVFALTCLVVGLFTGVQHAMRSPLTTDAAWYNYMGRMVASGQAIPYLHLWEVKPAMNVWSTAIFAVLTGADPVQTQGMVVGLTIAAVGVIATLLYRFGREVGTSTSALIAPAAFFLFYRPYFRPAYGIAPKLFVSCFAITGLYLIYNERWRLAGLSLALACGYWQAAGLLAIVGLIKSYPDGLKPYVSGGLIGGAIIIVPLAILSPAAVIAMFSEMTLPLLVEGESWGLVERLVAIPYNLGYALVPAVIGVGALVKYRREWWWITVPVLGYVLIVLFADFDGSADLTVAYALSMLGLAIAVRHIDRTRAVRGTVFVLIVASAMAVPTVLGGEPIRDDIDVIAMVGDDIDKEHALENGWGNDQEIILFVLDEPTDRCHVRLSRMEKRYLRQTPAEPSDRRCGIQAWSD